MVIASLGKTVDLNTHAAHVVNLIPLPSAHVGERLREQVHQLECCEMPIQTTELGC